MAAAVTWILSTYLILASPSPILRQYSNTTLKNQGICLSKIYITLKSFYETYKDCIVVLGNLQITTMERTNSKDFRNISLPNLREVTGFLVVYRVNGLESLGQLFPNLARIRGEQLLNNYGLIIHDVSTLKEIGLYGLLKIDRGGVIVWGVPKACFVDSVDWSTIAPRSRHVINPQTLMAQCNIPCTCSANATLNHCWNNKKCQIYLEGPEADPCHEQCLGCRKTKSNECSLCRHYTYNGTCVSECPSHTLILPYSQYCITAQECDDLHGWIMDNTCVFDCPIDYMKTTISNKTTCVICTDCSKTCGDLLIQSIRSIQEAEHCVYVNGSLTIHLRAVKEAMEELRTFLWRIEEVYDYVHIHGSLTISSLDFLSSLRRIRGRKLRNYHYSLVVNDMSNLQALFTKNVTENLKVDQGTLQMLNNPMLCVSHIDKLKPRFPSSPYETIDLPEGSNGYSGSCKEVSMGVSIRVVNETSAVIMFPTKDLDAHYSVLYVRLPPGVHQSLVPETCSESEWYSVNAHTTFENMLAVAELMHLRPASTYAVCIESFDPSHRKLARSTIYNFTTPVGLPKPPFIRELAASGSETVVISWVDHVDYLPHLHHYDLDVSLIEIDDKDVTMKDQCKNTESSEIDITQHALVMKPPSEYARGCESMCGMLSSVTVGAMIEEPFDVCSQIDCDVEEKPILQNTSYGSYVKTLVLKLSTPRDKYRIGKLAPFRDYRFRIRACTVEKCSRFVREVIRTLPMNEADVPSLGSINVTRSGLITVRWEPPKHTNGPIISYTIEVLSKKKQEYFSQVKPQTWCVASNQTEDVIKSTKADNYSVRVCSRSMAFNSVCSSYKIVAPAPSPLPTYKPSPAKVLVTVKPTWWWYGVIFGILVNIISIFVGCFYKRRSIRSDLIPIVDFTSSIRNESEPPANMFSDFAPVYSIPLRETVL